MYLPILLVAYKDDPAGYNMAQSLMSIDSTLKLSIDVCNDDKSSDVATTTTASTTTPSNQNFVLYSGKFFDLAILESPIISADWIFTQKKIIDKNYASAIFLSKHQAKSGVLALTCHSTGNFSTAEFGGSNRQIAPPFPLFQKMYLQKLYQNKDRYFCDFDITIEATHHGPTALDIPSVFVEIGTTPTQWNDKNLCRLIAEIIYQTITEHLFDDNHNDGFIDSSSSYSPLQFAICFGGPHYSTKFTKEILQGTLGLGTVVPKHALSDIDQKLFDHILHKNMGATTILLDWKGLGDQKSKIMQLATTRSTNLKITKI